MAKSAAARPRSLLIGVARFIPALVVFAATLPLVHTSALVPLLVGNALMLTAICAGIGFDMESSFARSVARRGLVGLVLLSLYTGFVAVLLAAPALWLMRDPSLPAALALSAAALLALLSLWRLWPAFALPFVWDDAFPQESKGSWLFAALRRSLAFARHLTGEHELFFTHGLPAALSVLVACVGALALAGLGGIVPVEVRWSALIIYALAIVPLAHLVLATRCVNALLTDAGKQRARDIAEPSADVAAPPPALPSGIGASELGATLLCAARSGQIDLALAALQRGADPDTLPAPADRDQRSVLIHAVILPDLRLLRGLIAKGANVNRVHGGLAPLIAATRDSYQGRPDAIMTLLANGADTRVVDADGNTALHHAALCGEPIVTALLLDAAAPINAVNHDGSTPLGVACANANWALAEFLLERGARSEVEHAQPALQLAAGVHEDDATGVKLLLRKKARVDAFGRLDRTALMTAALCGHARIAEALIAAGANVDLTDQHGTTALMEAARSGAVAIIHALGKRKVDPDRTDATGRTGLIIACTSRHASEETVRALLALGADRRKVAGDGKRALDHAAASGRWHIVALLDPGFPLPSSLAPTAPLADAASAAHLIDALRFQHWNVADDMRHVLGDWAPAEFASLYLGLVDAEYGQARDWVCNAGLPLDARCADGRSLLDTLIDNLPSSLAATRQLLDRGAPVGGAALVARVLALAPASADNDALCALAGELLARGADPFGRVPGEIAAVHLAASHGAHMLVDHLLERGEDVNARDARGRMPLHFALKAAGAPAVAVLRVLIRHGADPERVSASGETPLGLALARAERDLVYWLNWPRWRLPLRAIAASDLPHAAANGDVDAVDKLLGLGIDINAVDAQGATALIRAAGSGYAALVVRLLEAGADATRAAQSGATCLSAAVAARRESVVTTLLQHDVAADQRLPGGGTPLMIAAALGLPRLAEPLLERGADANAADDRGNTPLLAAAQFAFDNRDTAVCSELLELLLRSGARLEARNQSGQTALLLILGARAEPGARCDAQHLGQLVRILLEKGAAADCQDQRGVSPLHACAMHGLLGVARALKAHGAPVDQLDGLGRSAGQIAALLGYVDVANELGVMRNPVPGARQTLRKRVID